MPSAPSTRRQVRIRSHPMRLGVIMTNLSPTPRRISSSCILVMAVWSLMHIIHITYICTHPHNEGPRPMDSQTLSGRVTVPSELSLMSTRYMIVLSISAFFLQLYTSTFYGKTIVTFKRLTFLLLHEPTVSRSSLQADSI